MWAPSTFKLYVKTPPASDSRATAHQTADIYSPPPLKEDKRLWFCCGGAGAAGNGFSTWHAGSLLVKHVIWLMHSQET